MHLLQFEPKLPATDKFYSDFGNIFLQRAYHRHMDTYALKELEFSACASPRWWKENLATIKLKWENTQTAN